MNIEPPKYKDTVAGHTFYCVRKGESCPTKFFRTEKGAVDFFTGLYEEIDKEELIYWFIA